MVGARPTSHGRAEKDAKRTEKYGIRILKGLTEYLLKILERITKEFIKDCKKIVCLITEVIKELVQ